MKLRMYAVRDEQVGAYMQPYFMQADGQAFRSFQDEVNRDAPDNILHRHPKDFSVWFLGEFESDTGLFVLEPAPKLLVRGDVVVIREESQSQMRLKGVN